MSCRPRCFGAASDLEASSDKDAIAGSASVDAEVPAITWDSGVALLVSRLLLKVIFFYPSVWIWLRIWIDSMWI